MSGRSSKRGRHRRHLRKRAAAASGAAARPWWWRRARIAEISACITGLGAVTPIYTVTVKSRVDGRVDEDPLQGGRDRPEGRSCWSRSIRGRIKWRWSRPKGQLMRDQALLENAHVDLARYKTLMKQNAIPEQQLATQEALVTQDEGTVKNDQARSTRETEPGLLPHHCAHHGTHRAAAGGSGQHRSRQRYHRTAGDHADPAHQRDFHRRRRSASAGVPADARRPEAAGGGLGSRTEEQAGGRHADDHRQPDRSDHRNGASCAPRSTTKMASCFPTSS